MKNYAYLFLAALTIFPACEKEVIPEPVPVPKNLKVFSDNIKITDLLYKMDPVTGDTYLEAWKYDILPGQKDDETLVPYLQRLGKDGKLKWDQWVPYTRKGGLYWVNNTEFDTTTDGCVIDGFNALDQNGMSQLFITKINPDGSYAWGNEGKLFYDFGDKAIEEVPCESFVAADNEGGAWIAAGNGSETLVIGRVNRDGDFVVEPIVFSSQKGTAYDKDFVRRPQMYVGPDNSLFALLQYGNDFGGGSTLRMIKGYYDIVKIPADGNVGQIVQYHLTGDDEIFHPGMSPLLTEDGKGGAYAIISKGKGIPHPYLYHFDSDANVNVRDVDLFPSGGSSGGIDIYAAIDSKTNDLLVLMQDIQVDDYQRMYSFVNLQIADLGGKLKYGPDGENIFVTDNNDFMESHMGYFIPAADGKFIFTFVLNVDKQSKYLYQSRIDINKPEMQDLEKVTEIDAPLTVETEISSSMKVTDGFLRHIWYTEDDRYIYGYDIGIN